MSTLDDITHAISHQLRLDGFITYEEWFEKEYTHLKQLLELASAESGDGLVEAKENYNRKFKELSELVGGRMLLDRLIRDFKLPIGGKSDSETSKD